MTFSGDSVSSAADRPLAEATVMPEESFIDADPLRPRLVVATAAVGIVVTVAVFAFPAVKFAYYSPAFHVALETVAGLTAALTAFLFFGRLRDQRLQSNWALVYALALSCTVNVGFGVLPAIVGASADQFSVWSTSLGRVAGAAAFAFAAFAPPGWAAKSRHIAWTITSAPLVTAGIIGLIVGLNLDTLPVGAIGGEAPLDATDPLRGVHPTILSIQLLGLALYTAAALGFIRRSERSGDELMRWLAAGAMLAAVSRLHYVAYPSLYSGWVYTGDILRLGFYGLLLVGAVGEIRRYWHGLAAAAAADERRRLARDLHDGLAQELAYIVTQSRWLSSHGDDEESLRAVTAAADRALDESRRAIAALTRPSEEPLETALAQAAEEVGDRVGMTVRLHLEHGPDVPPGHREELIRIVREAIANAGRHSQADEVVVTLSNNGRLRIRISDEGVGFDPEHTPANRFGLTSMRERAEALDADFSIVSSPGHGTQVEVAL